MHVRHLVTLSPVRAADQFRPSPDTRIKQRVISAESVTRWYHVCSVADETANGYPVTRRFLELYVADFYRRSEPGPVYRGHADTRDTATGEEPPAAGWVLALELDSDGRLWALYELTERLHAQIGSGEYRFNSIYGGAIEDDDGEAIDAEFISIAVTNRPAVSNLIPMAATRASRLLAKGSTMNDVELIKAALKKLSPESTLADIAKWVEAQRALLAIESGESAPAEDAPAEPAVEAALSADSAPSDASGDEPAVEPVELAEPGLEQAEAAAEAELYAVVSAAAAEAGTDAAGALAMLKDRMDAFVAWLGGTPDSGAPSDDPATDTAGAALSRQLSVQSTTIKSLSKQLDELRAKEAEREAKLTAEKAEADVEALIAAGRLAPEQRVQWVELATKQPETFVSLSTSLPQAVPVGRVTPKTGPTDDDTMDMTPRNDAERKFLAMSRSPDAVKRKVLAQMRAGTSN